MGNSATSVFFSYKVKFTREIPNDFYLSGDRVQGIIQILTNDHDNDLNFKYGPLYVELIGEFQDFKTTNIFTVNVNNHPRYTKGVHIFFRKQTQLIQLPNNNQQLGSNRLRTYRWAFDGLLDSLLPSSLPPDGECDPCICYYAYAYLRDNTYLTQKTSFLVFTRTPMSISMRQTLHNYVIEANAGHKGVRLHCTLPNNGLVVPGQPVMLQIKIDNPMKFIIKSIRATLKQYRTIIDEETNVTIFSSLLPGFKLERFNSEYRQSTYELPIPLEKCRLMAPTSHHKNVRYELHIQCHLNCSFNNHFTLTLPVICTTDHQPPLQIMDELKSLPGILQYLQNIEVEKPPPSYEDFIVSEILPRYKDIVY